MFCLYCQETIKPPYLVFYMSLGFFSKPISNEYLNQNSMYAIFSCIVKYHGKASHAAAYPWEGVNALDAAVLAYNSLSMLRQQLKPDWRLHGKRHTDQTRLL